MTEWTVGASGCVEAAALVRKPKLVSQLQTVVMTKRSDPRFGETIYRLTNIQRGVPSPSLFVPPPDYTVKETTGPVDFHFQRKEKE